MGKTTVIYVKFIHDVPGQKLLKSTNVSRSYCKNNTGTAFWDTVYWSLRAFDWSRGAITHVCVTEPTTLNAGKLILSVREIKLRDYFLLRYQIATDIREGSPKSGVKRGWSGPKRQCLVLSVAIIGTFGAKANISL